MPPVAYEYPPFQAHSATQWLPYIKHNTIAIHRSNWKNNELFVQRFKFLAKQVIGHQDDTPSLHFIFIFVHLVIQCIGMSF